MFDSFAQPNTIAPLSATHSNELDRSSAAHLLRRCVIGPTLEEIDLAVSSGLWATVERLLGDSAPLPLPVNHFYNGDPNVPVGDTWVNGPFIEGNNLHQYREPSLRSWYLQTLLHAPLTLRGRMVMFWLNHFGIADTSEERVHYDYIRLLNERAIGNFRTLIKEITVHPVMLHFLHGRFSYKDGPNENYARELLELFTVQKSTEGDEHYTETDIVAIAEVLTGWRVSNFWGTSPEPVASYFQEDWHVGGEKQLSHHFGNAVVPEAGAREYELLIDVIFRHSRTALSICRDLYIFFCSSTITPEVEKTIIQPMARILIENDFEIKPVMRALLTSSHFFSRMVHGSVIKNPYEYLVSMARPFNAYKYANLNLRITYDLGFAYYKWGALLGMNFMEPPTVSGWPAYYQAPTYSRSWITGTTLKLRKAAAAEICDAGIWSQGEGRPFDWLGFLDALQDPYEIDRVIGDIAAVFLPRPLPNGQVAILKNILLQDLPDFEWRVEYTLYQKKPTDPGQSRAIETKLKLLFEYIFNMPAFHLQ